MFHINIHILCLHTDWIFGDIPVNSHTFFNDFFSLADFNVNILIKFQSAESEWQVQVPHKIPTTSKNKMCAILSQSMFVKDRHKEVTYVVL